MSHPMTDSKFHFYKLTTKNLSKVLTPETIHVHREYDGTLATLTSETV